MGAPRLNHILLAAAPWTWLMLREARFLGLLAVALPAIAMLTLATVLLAAAMRRDPWLLLVGASIALLGTSMTILPWRAQPGGEPAAPLRIVFANLLLSNQNAELAALLTAQHADVLITVETNGKQFVALSAALGEPAIFAGDAAACSLDGARSCSALNVWTDLPVEAAPLSAAVKAARGTRFEVATSSGALTIVAVHLPAPSPLFWRPGRATPNEHARVLDDLTAEFADNSETVLVGDLNLSDRQSQYREMLDTWTDAMRRGTVGPTSVRLALRPLLLRIDHLFISEGLCATDSRLIDLPGSDHKGLVSSIGNCEASQ